MALPEIRFIINPKSSNGETGRIWPVILKLLQIKIKDFDYKLTNYNGHAIELSREALKIGIPKIVSVGGDGTINEVINGFFNQDGSLVNANSSFCTFPKGTGCDFVKTTGFPVNINEVVKKIEDWNLNKVDVGYVEFVNHSGSVEKRFFMNIADAGMGGETVERVNNTTKVFGGFFSFLWGTFKTLLFYENKEISISLDNGQPFQRKINTFVVANGQYFGGGMWIAPQASIRDGQFEVIVVGDFSKFESLSQFKKIYKGTHLTLDKIEHFKAKHIKIESMEKVLLDVDGEQPGLLPATFNILPASLNLVV